GAFTSQPATADSTLDLIAEVHHGHWRISGRWEADPKTPLKLGAWMQDFATGPDPAFQLPKILRDLEVHLFDLTFDSGAQTLSARVEAATGNVELELALSVAPEPTGDWVIHAEGLLTHGTLSFALVFDRAAHKRMMAVLVAEEPVTASLDDIIAVLGGVPGPLPTPSVGFQAALAVFDEDAAGQELRLLAVDLETGVDLTTLPLVGPLIREEGHFGLSFQLSHASRALTKADAPLVEAINGRLPQGAIPLPEAEKIPKDLSMLTLLKIGDQTIDLALPIKPGTDGEPEEDHTPAAPPAPTQDGFKWKKLDKTVGPVHLSRVGARYRKTAASEPEVTLALDGGLTMGPVHFSLNGLGLAATLHKAGKPRVSAVPQLDGLGLDYQSGPVQMAGAFQRNGPGDYAGAALLGTEALTLTALGSYVATDEGKSLFVYAVLDRPLGGPAFFFVTGLAAGFGYNRALALPPVKEVARFPLIAQATKPATKTPDLNAGLAELRDAVPVEFGQYFLAVGIKFNSFKLIDSFALLSVQFGRNFEVDLLGLSRAVIPPPDAGKTPVAKVEVALKAVFRPEEGVLRLDAVLTEASFLLSRKCKLRGGFAFYAWFKDQGGHQAGDFVATLGGYHPQFDLKAHPGF
ncbi:MAG: DUF6603 domain-containing protein, partial [Pseudomonadota bacterium]